MAEELVEPERGDRVDLLRYWTIYVCPECEALLDWGEGWACQHRVTPDEGRAVLVGHLIATNMALEALREIATDRLTLGEGSTPGSRRRDIARATLARLGGQSDDSRTSPRTQLSSKEKP